MLNPPKPLDDFLSPIVDAIDIVQSLFLFLFSLGFIFKIQ